MDEYEHNMTPDAGLLDLATAYKQAVGIYNKSSGRNKKIALGVSTLIEKGFDALSTYGTKGHVATLRKQMRKVNPL